MQKRLVKIDYHILGLLIGIEYLLAAIITGTIAGEGGAEGLAGFSASRLGLMILLVLISAATMVSGAMLYRSASGRERYEGRFDRHRRPVIAVLLTFAALGWIALQVDEAMVGRNIFYFERLRPAIVATGLAALQKLIVLLIRYRDSDTRARAGFRELLPAIVFGMLLLVFFGWSYLTQFGLVSHERSLWNVPGMPVSALQVFLLFMSILVASVLLFGGKRALWRQPVVMTVLIPVVIYLTAVLVWGLTPLVRHYFSLYPAGPAMQPFPFSDARVHDVGAISILNGDGIFFRGFTDKPLYMSLLALMHLIAGYDYVAIQWLQVMLLALIPVAAYFLMRDMGSEISAVLLAGLIILQQRNAIVLSYQVSSVNVKLLVTEVFITLGTVMLAWALVKWRRTAWRIYAVLIGLLIGTMSLIRLNPYVFLPTVVVLVPFILKVSRKEKLVQAVILVACFLAANLPWLITGVDAQGRPWIWAKLVGWYEQRYSDTIQGYAVPKTPRGNETKNSLKVRFSLVLTDDRLSSLDLALTEQDVKAAGDAVLTGFPRALLEHFVHNFTTSLMILPDTLRMERVTDLGGRVYWEDGGGWDGHLPAGQLALIVVNLATIAVGMGWLWSRHGWLALMPLYLFAAYNASMSFALSSGGRYVVPINWIVLLYYACGLAVFLRWMLRLLPVRTQPRSDTKVPEHLFTERQPMVLVSLLVLLSLLVPVMNLIVPRVVTPELEPITEAQVLCSAGLTPVAGQLHYPYQVESELRLTMITSEWFVDEALDQQRLLKGLAAPSSGMHAVICKDERGTIADAYYRYDGSWLKFWSVK